MKIRPVGAESFHADRQTNMKMLYSLFRVYRRFQEAGADI